MKLEHPILPSVIYCSQSVFGQEVNQQPKTSGNPVLPGWCTDPEGIVLGDECWIYLIYSTPYDKQIFMDAFSSKSLMNWTKYPEVLSKENTSQLRCALRVPTVIHANDEYYIFFGTNDVQNNNKLDSIGIAVANNPAGPSKGALDRPLIDKFANGVQPIDRFIYKDDDGQCYMYYGD